MVHNTIFLLFFHSFSGVMVEIKQPDLVGTGVIWALYNFLARNIARNSLSATQKRSLPGQHTRRKENALFIDLILSSRSGF
ncbi:MAG: hypothetical protein GT601_11500 [Acidaminobacter sp.]|uniref:hypothetical protein n=1 Tax=Acidaminobacter sp. TaxID=1872102 RepID=UPI001382E897|nr:hypothetical protein [Acidaminobacter sp.]MZQ98290.1 hypothetical protein [Acidaminobacter sp.]